MEWSNITITDMQTYFELTPAVDKIVSLFFEAKDYKRTIKAAKKVLLFAKTDSDKFLGHFFIANSLSAMNDIDKAASEALKALKYCDNFNGSNNSVFWCYSFLARYYYVHKHMFKEAMEVLEKGRRFAGTNENLYAYYINMARLYGQCEDSQDALEMAQSALQYAESDVEIADCYLQMAGSECDLSEFDIENHGQEAIKYSRLCLDYVEKSLSENKGNILSLRNMACLCYKTMCIIYEERGEKDKAIEEANHALQYIDGDREDEKEMHEIIARCYEDRKDGSAIKPLRMLLRYCDTDEERIDVHCRLASEYINIDDLEKEKKEYEVLIKLDPGESKFYACMLLSVYHEDGDIQSCKNLIIKYGLRKDEPGMADYVKNDPELKKYLK